MQVRAIIEAAIECHKAKVKVLPEIMIPLTLDKKELGILVDATRRVADDLIKKAGVKLPYLVGTMIELPRAALLANEIAEVAEFFSFGTNDLTQTTMGLSRDDAGRFLPDYVDEKKAGVFAGDPFQTLDTKGVGMLMTLGHRKGARDASKAEGWHLRRTRRRCGKREVLPPDRDGLRERFAVPRADFAAGGGAGRGGKTKQEEGARSKKKVVTIGRAEWVLGCGMWTPALGGGVRKEIMLAASEDGYRELVRGARFSARGPTRQSRARKQGPLGDKWGARQNGA